MKRIACIAFLALALGSEANAGEMLTSFYHARAADIAAHKTLPFGTVLQLTNPRNGRTVTVRIQDRGPFIRGRKLDISRQRAAQLGMVGQGVAYLEVKILHEPHR